MLPRKPRQSTGGNALFVDNIAETRLLTVCIWTTQYTYIEPTHVACSNQLPRFVRCCWRKAIDVADEGTKGLVAEARMQPS